jgi:hypothetical protein
MVEEIVGIIISINNIHKLTSILQKGNFFLKQNG